jgi:hypothetical protein
MSWKIMKLRIQVQIRPTTFCTWSLSRRAQRLMLVRLITQNSTGLTLERGSLEKGRRRCRSSTANDMTFRIGPMETGSSDGNVKIWI